MQISWYGNAVVKLEAAGKTLVTDPYVSRNPEHAKLADDDLRGTDAFLVTHGHFDHVVDLPGFMERLDVPAFVPPVVAANLGKRYPLDALMQVTSPGTAVALGEVTVTPYAAKHVKFDLPLIGDTLSQVFVRSKLPKRFTALGQILADHIGHPMGQCVGWLVEADGKRLLHFGSLALDPNETYPEGVDLLSLPYQGSSKLAEFALQIVDRIKPKRVYLQHFDDTFPPLSQDVPTDDAVALIGQRYPDIEVVIPDYRTPIEV